MDKLVGSVGGEYFTTAASVGRRATTTGEVVMGPAMTLLVATMALGFAGMLLGCDQSECGNGIVEHGEQCDDGNAIAGDGCNATCETEFGWECNGTTCHPICGDGHVVGGEICDYNDHSTGEYCSSTCDEVLGWCGDGELFSRYEQCDPGSTPVRGCVDCQEEFGFSCSGVPVQCVATGLPGDLLMDSLDEDQRLAFCEWLIDTLGGPGADYVCGSYQYTNRTYADCASYLSSISFGGCTVADLEDHMAQAGTRCSWTLGGDPSCI